LERSITGARLSRTGLPSGLGQRISAAEFEAGDDGGSITAARRDSGAAAAATESAEIPFTNARLLVSIEIPRGRN
jgi:hypothetical protein